MAVNDYVVPGIGQTDVSIGFTSPATTSSHAPRTLLAPGLNTLRVMRIAHPTDLSGHDHLAFEHAAALAAASGSRLVTVFAGATPSTPPDIGDLSRRWKRPIDHEFRSVDYCDEIVDTVITALREIEPDLVVVGMHTRHGLSALLHGSVGEGIARNCRVPVLVVPNECQGFVGNRGEIKLRRIVVPASNAEAARQGTEAARTLLAAAHDSEATIELVHVGPLDRELEALGATRIEGGLEEAILSTVRTRELSMLVMPTHGHDSPGDVLRGSHTERVIREGCCPVLSVPV